jgi:arylsulfatase A-like enzyme
LYERSLVVLVADHGESLGEHGFWFCHGENVYAEEARVPLIVHVPSTFRSSRGPPGSRRRKVASLLDLGSTILDAFGLAPLPGRGRSLLAPPPAEERVAVTSAGIPGTSERRTAVAGERFRLVSRPGSEPQLFDLLEDPLESLDRSATMPEVLRDLIARRSAFLAVDARPKVAHGILRADADLDEPTRTALRRLGYGGGE